MRLGGVVLLLISVAVFFLEANSPGLGFPAVGAIAALVLGGYLLVDPSASDTEGVSPWAIGPIALAALAFFVFVIPAALRAQRAPSQLLGDNLVGAEGVAETDLSPTGIVHVHAEKWSATSSIPVDRGASVRVTGTSGLRLEVEPLVRDVSAAPAEHTEQEPQGG